MCDQSINVEEIVALSGTCLNLTIYFRAILGEYHILSGKITLLFSLLSYFLTLLLSEWPKLYGVLAILSAIGLMGVNSWRKEILFSKS